MELLHLPALNVGVPHPPGSVKRKAIVPLPSIGAGSSSSDDDCWSPSSCDSSSNISSSHSAEDGAKQSMNSTKFQENTQSANEQLKLRKPAFRNTNKKGRRRVRSQSIDEQMNFSHLKRLEHIFNEGSRGGSGLDLEQFRIAMKKTMGSDVNDAELEMLFMKVDTNCDGTLDWGEYLSYMLLEFQEKKNMFSLDQDCPFPNPLVIKSSCQHSDIICSIRLLQAYTTRFNNHGINDPDDAASRWLTLSRDGMLNVWYLDWALQKSYALDGSKSSAVNPNGGLSVTDMVCMPNCNTIAVASTAYEISFYTMMTNMIQKRFQIRDLRYCALTMDYSYDLEDPQNAILVWGDTSGSLTVIRFYINPNLSLFSAPMCVNNKISMIRVLCGRMHGIRATLFRNVHNDWIRTVRYYKNSKDQESLVSCCIKPETAVFFADITEKASVNPQQKPQIVKKSHFAVRKGVLCHCYDPDWNIIVAGSRDGVVRVWNPYVANKSMVVLKGHTYAVVHILMRSSDHQAISISKDKNIRIWDLRDYTCKQNIPGRNVVLGRSEISAALFSNRHKELVLGTTKIGIYQPRNPAVASHKQLLRSHQKPVVSVLYNPVFKQIVSGGEDSSVCLWDIHTGTKKMQFFTGDDNAITCMAFDPTHRRLLTGGQNGDTMLWNFNNGDKLKCFEKLDDKEIVDVAFAKDRIITTSWNRDICSYLDSYDDEEFERFNAKHSDDITSMDFHKEDSILATSAYDGDIFLWSIETGAVLMMFNMNKSLLPIRKATEKSRKNKTLYPYKRHSYNHAKDIDIKRRPRVSGLHSNERYRNEKTSVGPKIITEFWLPSEMPWLRKQTKERSMSEDSSETLLQETSVSSVDGSQSSVTSTQSAKDSETPFGSILDNAIHKVLFLQTRRCEQGIGSLIAAGSDGWLTTWSVNQNGGMLGCFKACSKNDVDIFITSMVTDCDNKILVTGDTKGYIRKWDISDYCNEESNLNDTSAESIEKCLGRRSLDSRVMPIEEPPKLLISVRAHVRAITSLAYVDHYGLVASGGMDGSVRMWTDSGRYIGTFGQQDKWDISLPVQVKNIPPSVPYDVRRVASLNTLYTSKGTARNRWEKVRTIKTALAALAKAERQQSRERFSSLSSSVSKAVMVPKTSIEEQLSTVEKNLLEILDNSYAYPKITWRVGDTFPSENETFEKTLELYSEATLMSTRQAKFRRKSVTVWLQDKPHSIVSLPIPMSNAEKTFRRLQAEGIKSRILGKMNYKPKKRHRITKLNTEIRWRNKRAVVFCALPYVEIFAPLVPKPPQAIITGSAEKFTSYFACKKLALAPFSRRFSRRFSVAPRHKAVSHA